MLQNPLTYKKCSLRKQRIWGYDRAIHSSERQDTCSWQADSSIFWTRDPKCTKGRRCNDKMTVCQQFLQKMLCHASLCDCWKVSPTPDSYEVWNCFEHLFHRVSFISALIVKHNVIICSLGLLIHALLPFILAWLPLVQTIPVDHFMVNKVK